MRGLLVGVVVSLSPALALAAGPTVSIVDQSVIVAGMTPGGSVAFMGVAREPIPYSEQVVRRDAVVIDSDADGAAELLLEAPPATKSIWVAVDLATGALAAAAPAGFDVSVVPFPKLPETLDTIEQHTQYAELLLVRPGSGLWTISAGDGAATDSDATMDGSVRVAVADLDPIGESSGIASLQENDVVVYVDPTELDLATTVVKVE